MLDLHDLESSADDCHQENWHDSREGDNDIRGDGGILSHLGGLVTLNILHDSEECKIEVTEHVEPNVSIVSELPNETFNLDAKVGLFWRNNIYKANKDVGWL